MNVDNDQIKQGFIVRADVVSPNGITKCRPVVIITDTQEIIVDSTIVGVAITTSFPEPSPNTHIVLPWCNPRHPATKLVRRSAAVCNWLVELHPHQIKEVMGFVPTIKLLAILKKIEELHR